MSGSVSNPTGSVGGVSAAGLVDALTKLQGSTDPIPPSTMAQWQLWQFLTDRAGACSRYTASGYTYQSGEVTLRIVVTGWKPYPDAAPWAPPSADLPLVLPVVDPVGGDGTVSSDGVHRLLRPYFMKAGKNGQAGRDTAATAGSVTFTQISDTDPGKGCSGSYDLMFGSDHVTGSFIAPWC